MSSISCCLKLLSCYLRAEIFWEFRAAEYLCVTLRSESDKVNNELGRCRTENWLKLAVIRPESCKKELDHSSCSTKNALNKIETSRCVIPCSPLPPLQPWPHFEQTTLLLPGRNIKLFQSCVKA